ncbi:MAG: asparagine synthetase B family protein, partial [Planctomycetaceae bacterium]
MCGIAGGVWWDTALEISPQIQRRMTNSIRHRGPDADGQWRTESVDEICADSPAASLGHRRLSIIDVDGSAQPLANEDQTVWISFNGEIYNYRELRQQLIARGHQFRTEGDTEVIVHLYEEYGTDFAVHLRGMFALAIWDQNHRRLVLARDRAGKKPLYYRMETGRLCFGSELKALLQIPGISRELDHTA